MAGRSTGAERLAGGVTGLAAQVPRTTTHVPRSFYGELKFMNGTLYSVQTTWHASSRPHAASLPYLERGFFSHLSAKYNRRVIAILSSMFFLSFSLSVPSRASRPPPSPDGIVYDALEQSVGLVILARC